MAVKYLGRPPDSDHSILPKKWVDGQHAATRVDQAYIDAEVANAAVGLVTPSYVNQKDNLKARKTSVDTADANYALATELGATNGVAKMTGDVDPMVIASQLPTPLTTERIPTVKFADTIYLTANQEVGTTTMKEYRAATMTIPDPGYPYQPVIFAVVQGGALNSPQPWGSMGTGQFGQIAVLRSDDAIYGRCMCGSQKMLNFHTCLPHATINQTPSNYPALNSSWTFNLWLSLWSGTSYTFTPQGLQFYALIVPVL